MSQINFYKLFDFNHFNEPMRTQFVESQNELEKGINISFNPKEDISLMEQLSGWIKKNVSISDDYFFNELIDFKYHINSRTEISLTILQNGGSEIFNDQLMFDDINRILVNDSIFIDSLKKAKNIDVSLKIESSSSYQENMVQILKDNKQAPNFYLKKVIEEILSEKQIKSQFNELYSGQSFDFNSSIEYIYHLLSNPDDLKLLNQFRESRDIYFLLLLIKRNFWANSNL
jgi:hypothetical protein